MSRPPAPRARRFCVAAAVVVSTAFAMLAAPRGARAEATASPLVEAVERVELVVRDLARARAFYELLGFDVEATSAARGERALGVPGAELERVELVLGREHLTLLAYHSAGGRPVPRDTRGNDLWFQHVAIVVSDMSAAYAWLHAHHAGQLSSTPQKLPAWNRAAAGIEAFYFVDPEGHPLELIHFPRGKGDARWQKSEPCRRTQRELCNFLGIDHTAITVDDTEQSLAYYRDRLGLRVAGESENYGPEQEHLNGVFGAHLRITALRAAAGPGIELLEYLAPRGGRPTPVDSRPDDAWHTAVVVHARSAALVRESAVATGGRDVAADTAQGRALVHDRDGHALAVTEARER